MTDLPDLTQPWPDLGHEAIRQEVMAHLDALNDAFLVAQTTAEALQIALSNTLAMQRAVTEQAAVLAGQVAALDALTTRVADLEQAGDVPLPSS